MPRKETCPMDERMQFVADYLKEHWAVADLCRRYGISRKTDYKWITRYETEGWAGMHERSRAPHTHRTPISGGSSLARFRWPATIRTPPSNLSGSRRHPMTGRPHAKVLPMFPVAQGAH